MAKLGEANIGGRMVPAWLLNLTAEELDSLKSRWYSNPNLLDNWYFANPVNQRGVTSGNTTPNVYFIDRWLTTYGSATGKYSLDTGGVTLTPATDNSCAMFQRFENVSELDGKILTASVLFSDGTLFCGTITRINGSLQWLHDRDNIALYINSSNEFTISIYVNPRTITAVKLELGSQQTLAHQENGNWVLNEIPNYGEQLARCQRYFVRYTGNKTTVTANIGSGVAYSDTVFTCILPLPVPMRTIPTFSMNGAYVSEEKGLHEISNVEVSNMLTNAVCLQFTTQNLTTGYPYFIKLGGEGCYIDLFADLL